MGDHESDGLEYQAPCGRRDEVDTTRQAATLSRSESVVPADWRLGRSMLGRRLGRDQGHAGELQTKETCDGWHRRPA